MAGRLNPRATNRVVHQLASFWAAAGALLTTVVVFSPNVARVTSGMTLQELALHLAIAVVVIVLAAVGGGRVLFSELPSMDVQLSFTGLALVGGALLAAVSAYLPNPVPAMPVWILAVALVGVGLSVPVLRTVRTWVLAIIGVLAALVGMSAAYWLPGVLNGIATFAHERSWEFARPETPVTARLYVTFGAIWAVVAAAASGRLAEPVQATGAAIPAFSRGGDPVTDEDLLLETVGVDASYGQVQVLFDVAFRVRRGEAVALLGTNGAGKSTLLRTIFALKECDRGQISFDGENITGLPPEQLVTRGMAQVPGGRGIFPSLTVLENLRMAGYLADDQERIAQGIERVLGEFPNLRARLHEPAGVLSGGEQQMLALSRAWIMRPRLLAIDELTLGLAPQTVEQLVAFVERVKQEGTALVLVEQSVNTALRVADRAYFMERGAIRFEGRTADLLERPDLIRSVFLEGGAAATARSTA